MNKVFLSSIRVTGEWTKEILFYCSHPIQYSTGVYLWALSHFVVCKINMYSWFRVLLQKGAFVRAFEDFQHFTRKIHFQWRLITSENFQQNKQETSQNNIILICVTRGWWGKYIVYKSAEDDGK